MNTLYLLKVLSNEKRFNIIEWLKDPQHYFNWLLDDKSGAQGVPVGLIEEKIGLSQSTVSQYLGQLQKAGLISIIKQGQRTYCLRNEKAVTDFFNSITTLLLKS